MKISSWLVIPFLLFNSFCKAQQSEGIYNKPLTKVLAKVENKYHLKFEYDSNLVKGVNVYSPEGFSSNLESSLDNILKPLGLVYTKTSDNAYKIYEFEAAHRYTIEQGAKHLEKLLTLYSNAKEFDRRKKELRECIIQTLGINPNLKGGPLHSIMRPKVVMKGYTVQNVAFESLPGYYVTGSLYMPLGKGPFPVILSPHGHFYSETNKAISQDSGRYAPDMQTYCAGLAKMGAIVFIYDMYSWGESVLQTGNHAYHYTSFSLAIQTWNSIRSLDFILSLPDADKKRVGITGASGGGTQAILVSALDDRITADVPVVMVSSSFDGGCQCESGLPIHNCGKYKTNNAEIAAVFAPRPQLIISEDADWTRSVPGTDFPYLKKVYNFYGKEMNIENVHLSDKHHDYGITKRVPMYTFFSKIFGLNLKAISDGYGNIDENGITIQNSKDMHVFGKGNLLPTNAFGSHQEIMSAFKKFMEK
jgi:dienelactone hydrolase